MQHTNKINDTIRDAESASSLNTTADIFDLRGELLASLDALQLTEESISERSEASHDVATNEVLGLLEIALLGDLHLQLAGAEAQVEELLDVGGLAGGQSGIVLGDLVAASDAQIDAAVADEGRDVGGGQEDQRDGQVLDQRDVEAGFAAELDVTAGEEVESCLLQTSFCIVGFASSVLGSLCLFLVHVGIAARRGL
jgi:hypothetical protein